MYGAPAAWHRFCEMLADVDRRLPGRADRGGRRRGAGVRLVGRRAERRATIASSSCPTRAGSSSGIAPTRDVPTIHFGVGTGAILGRAARGRRRRHRRRLAHAARRGLGAHRPRSRHPGQPRSRRCCSARSSASSPRPTTCSRARAAGPATSSISATASCRRRRSNTSRRSRDTCTRRRRSLKSGDCGKFGRSVQSAASSSTARAPANLTSQTRASTHVDDRRSAHGARHAVVARRDAGVSAPRARRTAAVRRARRTRCAHNYEAIGGRSPLTEITLAQAEALARAARSRHPGGGRHAQLASRSSRTRSRVCAAAASRASSASRWRRSSRR